jgi:cytochrome c551/c552
LSRRADTKKVVAFIRDVAAKYKGKSDAEAMLIAKIGEGSGSSGHQSEAG